MRITRDYEVIECPTCKGKPDQHISIGSRHNFKSGCSTCKGKGSIKVISAINTIEDDNNNG